MKNIVPLQKQAIEAARDGNWHQAICINEEILENSPKNINALNRLALAQIQLDLLSEATASLNKVLEIDKNNKIAQKNLDKIKKRDKGKIAQFGKQSSYIEEPGKAKVIELIRLAEKKSLANTVIGQECVLEPKKSFISINTSNDNNYVGTLPKDISCRLSKLITNGNKYYCVIQSINSSQEKCAVYIEEVYVSKKNLGKTSFPTCIKTEYLDPEIVSLEHELKNDYPVEFELTDDDGDANKVEEFEETDKSIANSPIQDEDEED